MELVFKFPRYAASIFFQDWALSSCAKRRKSDRTALSFNQLGCSVWPQCQRCQLGMTCAILSSVGCGLPGPAGTKGNSCCAPRLVHPQRVLESRPAPGGDPGQWDLWGAREGEGQAYADHAGPLWGGALGPGSASQEAFGSHWQWRSLCEVRLNPVCWFYCFRCTLICNVLTCWSYVKTLLRQHFSTTLFIAALRFLFSFHIWVPPNV